MLSAEQHEFYRTNGYLHVRGLLTAAEAAFYRQQLHDLAERLGERDATWSSVKSGDPAQVTRLMHCHDVQFYSAAFTSLLVDPRFTRVAQGIVGPNVQLHHTKMFIKPPENGSPFPMHQDYPYFPHEHHSMIAAIIHFDDAPQEKGCLRVVPGSHKLGPLEAVGQDHHLPEDRFRSTVRCRCRRRPAMRSSCRTCWCMAPASIARTSRARRSWCRCAIPRTCHSTTSTHRAARA